MIILTLQNYNIIGDLSILLPDFLQKKYIIWCFQGNVLNLHQFVVASIWSNKCNDG